MRTRLPTTLTQHLAVVALNALHDGRAGSNLTGLVVARPRDRVREATRDVVFYI